MQTVTFKQSLILWIIGVIGVLSLLITPFPISIFPTEVQQKINPETFKYLLLINPLMMVTLAVLMGHFITAKVGLHSFILENFVQGKAINKDAIKNLIMYAIPCGLAAGIFLVLYTYFLNPYLPKELAELEKIYQPNFLIRFLYGGVTEEILLRWGILSLIIWIFKLIFKNTKPLFWWLSIIISSILFGMGHLPITFMLIKNVTPFLIFFIVSSNAIFGILAGWLFWKKGLEYSILAHISAHCVLILATF
jgi:hypothetical protein